MVGGSLLIRPTSPVPWGSYPVPRARSRGCRDRRPVGMGDQRIIRLLLSARLSRVVVKSTGAGGESRVFPDHREPRGHAGLRLYIPRATGETGEAGGGGGRLHNSNAMQ